MKGTSLDRKFWRDIPFENGEGGESQDLLITDDVNKGGLIALMTGPMLQRARQGYTEEEEARWADAIAQAAEEEVADFGGIRFESYALLAIK